ncbi:phage minor capsid protein [Streptomyces sp. WAC 01529]|uniref:phage minor capsid protein n=1 Tax=Streptomyces sp. WAC 01529 TaxID=2203205 RepID=UPI001F0B8A86|nr:phage minor capsid protein [Streptomyces sp. WAC 01529]
MVAIVSGTPLVGIDTRRQATQRSVQQFTDRGIGSFTDKAGCTWSMTTYAEMAVRTSTGRAAVEAHADRLRAADLDLVAGRRIVAYDAGRDIFYVKSALRHSTIKLTGATYTGLFTELSQELADKSASLVPRNRTGAKGHAPDTHVGRNGTGGPTESSPSSPHPCRSEQF